jgi:hypothetical protein
MEQFRYLKDNKFYALTAAHVYLCSDDPGICYKRFQQKYVSGIKIFIENVEYNPKRLNVDFDIKCNTDIAILGVEDPLPDFSSKKSIRLEKEISEYDLANQKSEVA